MDRLPGLVFLTRLFGSLYAFGTRVRIECSFGSNLLRNRENSEGFTTFQAPLYMTGFRVAAMLFSLDLGLYQVYIVNCFAELIIPDVHTLFPQRHFIFDQWMKYVLSFFVTYMKI